MTCAFFNILAECGYQIVNITIAFLHKNVYEVTDCTMLYAPLYTLNCCGKMYICVYTYMCVIYVIHTDLLPENTALTEIQLNFPHSLCLTPNWAAV